MSMREVVRAARLDRNLSYRKLAESIDVSPMWISDIENGKRFPTGESESFTKLAQKLGLNREELIAQSRIDSVLSKTKSKTAIVNSDLKLQVARTIMSTDLNPEVLSKMLEILKSNSKGESKH